MAEINELKTLETPNGEYNSFTDQTARKELKAKLSAPEGLRPGMILKVKSLQADGAVVLEGVEWSGAGEHPDNPVVDGITVGGENGVRFDSEGEPSTPVLALYGAQGDEPVRVSHVAPAQEDGEAVPLGQVKQLVKEHSGQSVNPIAKTGDMTQPVGVDEDGRLWTAPTADNGESKEAEDILLGTLPYTITEPGCYLLSDVDAVVTSGDGSTANLLKTLEPNGYTVTTATNVAYSGNELTADLPENMEAAEGAMRLYANVSDVLEPGQTYTIMYADKRGSVIYIQVLTTNNNNSLAGNILVQVGNTEINGSTGVGVLRYATFTVPDTAQTANLHFFGNDSIELELYIFAGTHTEIPAGQIIQLTAGVSYSTDLLIGATLGSESEVQVYQKQAEGASGGFSGNTYVAFADSIWAFASVDGTKKVPDAIAEILGCSVINCAVGGTRLSGSRDSTNEYYAYDMVSIADAIASGDFTTQIEGGKNAAFAQLQGMNWAAVSGIVLAFGANDFTAGTAFSGEDKTSVAGGLRYILPTILTARPTMPIFVTSTLRYVNKGDTVATHADGTVEDLNTLIRGICEEYGIPWIDMLHNFGSNAITRMTLQGDGVHLNNATNAGKRYADVWCAQFMSKTMGG